MKKVKNINFFIIQKYIEKHYVEVKEPEEHKIRFSLKGITSIQPWLTSSMRWINKFIFLLVKERLVQIFRSHCYITADYHMVFNLCTACLLPGFSGEVLFIKPYIVASVLSLSIR